MLGQLAAADGDNALRRHVALYARPRLLLIDEIGSLSYSNRHADLLFEIVSRRYQEKSTLLTTNRPFSEWGEVFPNAACVLSLLDRLVHNAEIIQIEGESHRLKEAKERSEARRKGRAARKRKSPPSPLPMTDCSPTEAPMFPNSSIPPYWSPEQALAVYEFREELRERIGDRYGEQSTERMRFEYEEQQRLAQLELFPCDEEAPF
jgi:hypothetical protein